jgi:hypothetical protein
MAGKSSAVLIRLTPADRARLQDRAEAAYLEAATWARQALLRALDAEDDAEPPRPRAQAKQKPVAKRAGRRRTS